MPVSNGANLGLMVHNDLGAQHYDDLTRLLRGLDALVQPRVKDKDLNTPPGSPVDGDCYIVGPTPTGAWAGWATRIARYKSTATAGWESFTPKEGWRVAVEDEDLDYRYSGSAWVAQPLASGMIPATEKGAASGVAPLDGSGKVPSMHLPSYVDDVLEYANTAAFPATGTAGIIYVALNTNKTYRWSGSAYVEISAGPANTDALPEGSTNKYFPGTTGALGQVLTSDGAGGFGPVLNISSGIYTPVLSNTTNIDASTAYPWQWLRVGNTVTVSGKVDIDQTAASIPSELRATLPVAATFVHEGQLAGLAVPNIGTPPVARIFGLAAGSLARFVWTNGADTSNRGWAVHFTYTIP